MSAAARPLRRGREGAALTAAYLEVLVEEPLMEVFFGALLLRLLPSAPFAVSCCCGGCG